MPIDQPPPLPTELQFDRAVFEEHAPPSLACRLCDQPISGSYYEVNGQPTCESCRGLLVASLGVDSGIRGVVAALASGVGAGVAGALLYYAVLAVTGYEIGLIALAVGLMVGHAVKWGSGGRGGRRFQIMAVAITYVAIVSTYVPFIVASINEPAQTTAAQTSPAQTGPTQNSPAQASPSPAGAAPAAAPAGSPQELEPAPARQPAASEAPPTLGEFVIGLAMLAGLLLALPFLGGFGNIMGLLIIGFALWESWKVNRRVVLSVSGPFVAGPEAPQLDAHVPVLS